MPHDPTPNRSPPDLEAERSNTETVIVVPAADAASGHTETLSAEEARQGHTGDHVRYVLALSLFCGALVLAGAGFIFFG